MIANDQQLAIVRRELDDLKAWRDRVLQEPSESDFERYIEVLGIERMIARVQEEVDTYENAVAGNVPDSVTVRIRDHYFGDIAGALLQLRLGRGLRQEDLARLLGKRQPTIARWENDQYSGYTLKELDLLARAMGCELQVSFVIPDDAGHPMRAVAIASDDVGPALLPGEDTEALAEGRPLAEVGSRS